MPNNYLSPYAVEAAANTNKQKIADAMRMQSLKPIQNVSNIPGSQLSWTQGLAKMIQAYMGNKMQDTAMQSNKDLAKKAQQDLVTGIQQYNNLRSGGSAPSSALQPNPDGSPQMANTPADPIAAIQYAMSHPHPSVQEVGINAMKGLPQPKDLMKYANPVDVMRNPNNPSNWRDKPNLKSFTPGSPILDINSGEFVNPKTSGGGDPFEVVNIAGAPHQKTSTGFKALGKNNISVRNEVNMPSNEKTATKKMWDIAGNAMAKSAEIAKAGESILVQTKELRELDDAGLHSGLTASPTIWLEKLADSFGMSIDKAKLGRTEAYKSVVTAAWNSLVSAQPGGHKGVVKEEAEQLKDILPRVEYSTKARAAIVDILETAARRNIDMHRHSIEAFSHAAETESFSDLANALKGAHYQPGDYGYEGNQLPEKTNWKVIMDTKY